MKKILALIVALTLVLSMGMAFAEDARPRGHGHQPTSAPARTTTGPRSSQGLNDAAEAAGINVQTSLVERKRHRWRSRCLRRGHRPGRRRHHHLLRRPGSLHRSAQQRRGRGASWLSPSTRTRRTPTASTSLAPPTTAPASRWASTSSPAWTRMKRSTWPSSPAPSPPTTLWSAWKGF